MPNRPGRGCVTPGCAGVAVRRGRCAPCARDADRIDYVARGVVTAERYGTAWRKQRASVLATRPLCAHCHRDGRVTAATEVDHITPLSCGGTNETSNLQPLCHSCHMKKTHAERAGAVAGGVRGPKSLGAGR
jgi:5-methylcytosine-specific restriction enzyme A